MPLKQGLVNAMIKFKIIYFTNTPVFLFKTKESSATLKKSEVNEIVIEPNQKKKMNRGGGEEENKK
ncbi:hypothetical protein BLOT_006122 [Blomia tropicalis]|nr:hypothetical protein BLOT_006122 [Blomia tropicalis]